MGGKSIKTGVGVDVSDRNSRLRSIAPNPSAGAIAIEFGVATAARVRMLALDLQGREVRRLVDGSFAPGRHHVTWDGSGAHGAVGAGVYFIRYETPAGVKTSRVVITR